MGRQVVLYLTVLFIVCTVCPPYNVWESADLVPRYYEWLLLAWLSGLVVSQLTNPEDRAGLGWIKARALRRFHCFCRLCDTVAPKTTAKCM